MLSQLSIYLNDPKGKAMQFEMNKIILSKGLAIIINVICFCFVVWKSIECFVKYSKAPKGTNVGVEYTGHQKNFPTITVCGNSPTYDNDSIKWNQTHLHQCGIDRYKIALRFRFFRKSAIIRLFCKQLF